MLKFSEVTVDQTTGSVTLRALFPNPNAMLLPGMFVRAELNEGVYPNGILAPQQGVSHDPKGNATAFVVGPDGKAQPRTLTTAEAVGDKWLVTDGLQAGRPADRGGTADGEARSACEGRAGPPDDGGVLDRRRRLSAGPTARCPASSSTGRSSPGSSPSS